ncbi:hypothetical protein V6N13_029801 [Hibiscus sabdariffa]|uniref:Leucine-rich repeat-containing N-terminal plant-type domain-containing protein n=2 Tax=Hibiscus sabdariffa TaxID=183260 RepID=A0ABR2T8V3_9ROSI
METRHTNNLYYSSLLCFLVALLPVSSCSGSNSIGVRCIESERKQVVNFKEGLIDRFGSLSSWVGLDCCKWQGVSCDNQTGHVSVLDLEKGTLKPCLLHLKYLTYLNLAQNSFLETQIPKFLGMLNNLRYLNLHGSGFSGEIPPHLGSFNFGLRAQSLVWLSGLASLESLDLATVNLRGVGGSWSKAVNMLPSLASLYLYHCGLTSLDLTLSSLEVLNLFGNSIKSPIPHCLEILYLGGNKLDGILPESLGAIKNLQEVDLNINFFWASIGNLSSLWLLELSYNKLNGTIPNSFGKLVELSTLDLVGNYMEGVLTETHLANLTRLDSFRLTTYRNRSLVFNVNQDWVPPFRLTTLVLINCLVGPSFPLWLQVQTRLSYVIVSSAGISDTIEEEWFARLFSNAWTVDLSNNSIIAKLPPKLYSEVLDEVDLSRNRFEGPIPLWLTNATHVYLQRNSFSGSVPDNIGELMPQLQTLFISRNQISGRLPSSICKMEGLKFLYASNNSLSGEIPSSLTSSCQLVILMLGDNSLRGNIPFPLNSCRQVQQLYVLQLRSNLLEGNIPEQFCHLSNIHSLDLSNNNIVGSIPKCFHNFTALKYGNATLDYEFFFELQDRIIGEQTMVVETKGMELEFSRTFLEVKNIDLSRNNLTGEFPKELCNLAFLDTLNFSRNRLSGNIPDNIDDLRLLEFLDLSFNNFSGPIPPSLSSLTLLNHLKLSYNNLSGRILTGNQLQTLNDSSNYEGNPFLCGVPLSATCPGDAISPPTPSSGDGDSRDKLWHYLSIAVGFIAGFWGVCGTLVLKESWRHAYFRYVDELKEKMLLWIALAAARSRRMFAKAKENN